MSKKISIRVENLSKAYQLGQIGTGTISRDLERWYAKVRGKEDPFLRIGEANDRSTKGDSDIVWSLKDINFEIEQGDAVGIIGRNGAGKSTLLKILSKVTAPTSGKISGRGRIASLLEVGTGFHPELSGRENIFLNGAILGMRKKEIQRKLDEIVDFAGIERYLDTPVKRYSSGMYVRLAFAVAAHLESEILIVDEVLAVGDAEFQKKCLGKMSDVSKGEGRTVLFVSHNMGMVNHLCDSAIVLKNGVITSNATTSISINDYLKENNGKADNDLKLKLLTKKNDYGIILHSFEIKPHFLDSNDFLTNRDIEIVIQFELNMDVIGLRIGFEVVHAASETVIFRSYHDDEHKQHFKFNKKTVQLKTFIPSNFLSNDEYIIYPTIGIHNVKWLNYKEQRILLNMINLDGINSLYSDERPGLINPLFKWQLL
ncbi:ABC transporter ATP-binding protein [Pedobacter sp. Leaf132]|uniref:ABC transporter ATP-binding protein n=1 Tax=Pedobacter sp. Leaf132 TaxID=2876557 RepID=UPI001E650B30|nr:ABC transporter ATP-binding protein [Pedobacter sp. Leaf132]